MDYREYQKASHKHLVACKSILDSISLLNGNPNAQIIQNNKLQSVLHNVYYLSGYSLEGIINYSIFKHYKWKQPSVYTTDYKFSDLCDLSFYPDTRSLRTGRKYRFCLSQHKFSDTIQILRRDFSSSKIPFIDRTEKVSSDVVKLFNLWCVEIRYHNENRIYDGVSLEINTIKQYVDTVDKIYNGLLKEVGLP